MLGFAAHAEDGNILHGFRELYHSLTLNRIENNISHRNQFNSKDRESEPTLEKLQYRRSHFFFLFSMRASLKKYARI